MSVIIASQPRRKRTRAEQIGEVLRTKILSPGFTVGDRLPSVNQLADQFEVSFRTAHLALEKLQQEGYIEKKNGIGTFVAARYRPMTFLETAAVCMESGAHLYGELWNLLMGALHERQMLPLGIDTSHGDVRQLVSRLTPTDVRYCLAHFTDTFPYDLFTQPAWRDRPVIALFGCAKQLDWPNLYRVSLDYAQLARLMVQHLKSLGHRHVLFLGTPTDAGYVNDPRARTYALVPVLMQAWEACGGTWSFLSSTPHPDTTSTIRIEEGEFLAALRAAPAPDAIVGTRDVETWEAQQMVRRLAPHLADTLGFFGFFDTPWSRAGSPPFTTVSLDLPAMVAAAMDYLDTLRNGEIPKKKNMTISGRLVVRKG